MSPKLKIEPRANLRLLSAFSIAVIGVVVVLAVSSTGSASEARRSPTVVSAGPMSDTVVAVGDIACPAGEPVTRDTCEQAAVAKRVARSDPAAVLLLGDIQYSTGALSDFRSSFGKSWSGLRKQWKPAAGNHEYATPDASGYFRFFGRKAGNARGNYSFDVAGWHFIALNSNCAIVACTANSAQGKWLKSDLAKHSETKCVAAFWHAPLFSSGGEHGNNPSVKPLWTQLLKAHAEIVLNGHDHDYERFAPQDQNAEPDSRGIREFVAGTGGRNHYLFGRRQPNSQVRIGERFGALSLALNKQAYRWKFVTTDGAVLDRGATRCH